MSAPSISLGDVIAAAESEVAAFHALTLVDPQQLLAKTEAAHQARREEIQLRTELQSLHARHNAALVEAERLQAAMVEAGKPPSLQDALRLLAPGTRYRVYKPDAKKLTGSIGQFNHRNAPSHITTKTNSDGSLTFWRDA